MKKLILLFALFITYSSIGQNCNSLLEAVENGNLEEVAQLLKTVDPDCIAKKVAMEKCYVGGY